MRNTIFGGIAAICMAIPPVSAAPNLSLGEIPKLASPEGEGLLIDLMGHMEALEGAPIGFSVAPSSRSIASVKSGKNDAHVPMIDPGKSGKLASQGLMFSHATLGSLEFGIFHLGSTEMDIDNLDGLTFESLTQTAALFDLPVDGSNCLPCTMKKVTAGRLNGLITAKFVGEQIISSTGTEGIVYTKLKTFPVRFVLRDGDGATDQWISAMVDELRTSGALQETLPMYQQSN